MLKFNIIYDTSVWFWMDFLRGEHQEETKHVDHYLRIHHPFPV